MHISSESNDQDLMLLSSFLGLTYHIVSATLASHSPFNRSHRLGSVPTCPVSRLANPLSSYNILSDIFSMYLSFFRFSSLFLGFDTFSSVSIFVRSLFTYFIDFRFFFLFLFCALFFYTYEHVEHLRQAQHSVVSPAQSSKALRT